MRKLDTISRFKAHQNIVLKGFDPVSSYGFTQVPNFIFDSRELSSNAKLMYGKLLSYAWHNDRVFPGQKRLAEEMGVTRQTINRAIAELRAVGFLEVERRGLGKTNLYILRHIVDNKKKRSKLM